MGVVQVFFLAAAILPVLTLAGSEVVTNTYVDGRTGVVVMPGLASQASDPPMQGVHMRLSSSSSARPPRSDIQRPSSSSVNTLPSSMATTSSSSASNSLLMQANSNRNHQPLYHFLKEKNKKILSEPPEAAFGNYPASRMVMKNRFTSIELIGRRYRRNTFQSTSGNNSEIIKTYQLLDEGEEKIQLCERCKNITLVLGNTGAGKSTFLQWFAGDNDKLLAKREFGTSGPYLIEDENRIGNTTLNSMTIFPELVIHHETDDAYYDCPGFSDTRSTSMEIATTYFIKKVADYAEHLKLIFVVNHSSVRRGVDRQDFVKLLRHVADFMTDINKYRGSIAIMVTKIDPHYEEVNGIPILDSDELVIRAIAHFLEEVKQWLRERLAGAGDSGKDKQFHEQAMKFVEILLIMKDGHYSRIGIFRRPNKPGPLSNIMLLQEGKKHVQRIVNENLAFTATSDSDFGYTISDTSKVAVDALAEGINDNISSNLRIISETMLKYYRHLLEDMCTKIRSFTNTTGAVDANPSDARMFNDTFNAGINRTTKLIEEAVNITTDQLGRKINESFNTLCIDGCAEAMQSISQQGKYFSFLQVVSDSALGSRTWGDLLQPFASYLSYSRHDIQRDINDVAEEINDQMRTNISNIAVKIKEYYQSKMRSVIIQQLPAEMNFGHAFIMNMTEKMKHSNKTQDLSRQITRAISDLDTSKISRNTNNVFRHGKYLTFLQIISNKTLDTPSPSQLITPLNETATYLRESQGWYEFLINLNEKLSTYDVQKNRMKYNVANIADWGHDGKQQGISITRHNFRQFMENIVLFDVMGYNKVQNIEADDIRVEDLRQVARLTLNKFHASCQSNKLTIKGGYIRLSEAILEIVNCEGNTIEIFALNKIFIDENLNKTGEKLKLTIIAPTWEVIGSRVINLSGADGQLHNPPKATNYWGNYSPRGADGMPGFHGGPAGSFFGIGTTFNNGNMLNVIASGGNGGIGQHGGDGANGREGDSPVNRFWNSKSAYTCKNVCNNGRFAGGYDCIVGSQVEFFIVVCHDRMYTIRIEGEDGTIGGDGGDGGPKGLGGKAGDIKIVTLGGDTGISSTNNDGRDGISGRGGQGGAGGKRGNSLKVKCKASYCFFIPTYNFHSEDIIFGGYNLPGRNGMDGDSRANIENIEPAAIIDYKAEIINDYKGYVRENLQVDRGGLIRKNDLIKFFSELDISGDVKRLYDTSGLVGELRGLERQSNLLQEKDSVFFYESLLDRINAFANDFKAQERSKEHNKTLGYMYTAVLGKLYDLKSDSDATLVIDIKGYFDILTSNMNALGKLQEKYKMVSVINNFRDQYKDSLDKKMEESQRFIEEEITPAIDQIHEQIYDKMDKLLSVIKELQKEADNKRVELLKKTKELEHALVLSDLFGNLKSVWQVANMLGPVGETLKGLVGALTSVPDSFVSGAQTAGQQSPSLPLGIMADLRLLKAQVKSIKDKQMTKNHRIIDYIDHEITSNVLLNDIRESLHKIKTGQFPIHDADGAPNLKQFSEELTVKIKKLLITKENELRTNTAIDDESVTQALDAIAKVRQLIQISEVSADTYVNNKDDQAKLDALSNAIQQAEEEHQRLKQYENKIESALAPTLENMEEDLKEIESKLVTKSQVALDVNKWQVQSVLRDMKLSVRQLTKEFQLGEDLTRCIEKLEESMTTLIGIYDRMQDCQEQQNLANYIAAVAAYHGPDDVDQVELEILIRSNLILTQYKTAVNAFKQWVFPFAGLYLERIMSPSHLAINNGNIEDLATKAVEQIEYIRARVDEYMTAIQRHDQHIHEGLFDSHHDSSHPFFVWRNEDHKEEISKLLSGEAIVVKADIRGSAPDKDAIKFNLLELNLKVTNATRQRELNDKLKSFKVSATHFGNSYYRYDDKLYAIGSHSENIEYSFEKDVIGVPIHRNQVYNKIKAGDFMLSPYAMWRIQLKQLKHSIPFNQLALYKDEADLELVGSGWYVTSSAGMPNLNVEKYHRAGTISTMLCCSLTMICMMDTNSSNYRRYCHINFHILKVKDYLKHDIR
ncbi:uncharacterized protein LOC108664972 isoform X3 [Hyalella azteca]|nr:uncharacterized protein LOC108664972 isoform X3 [Hyalella azteca]XP_018007171.1 uncharacterized protein LOC108664972 isoform X2 [Hyalella azteca]XP_047737643.1 uncharacterized protein LOC108664972 isoform X3 [Hyalella azteca]XP_047737644.1 uncharacterized protein LOC108664972 isoform X3 [Hyalella azteca]